MRRLVVGAGIAVVAALVALPPASAAERAPVREQWRLGATAVNSSPFTKRDGVAMTVHGTRVYLVGGSFAPAGTVDRTRAARDGAVLDLRTGRWSRLPKAPFRNTLVTGALWAGRRLVVVGARCP